MGEPMDNLEAIIVEGFGDFEQCAVECGSRYWDALDLMSRLGYQSYPSFANVVNKAISSCAQLGVDIPDAFVQTDLLLNGKKISSYRMTRFACFLVSMHADEKKPEVAAAKIYLSAIASSVLDRVITDDDLPRVELREEIKIGEKMLAGVAKAAGIHDKGYAFFKDAGIRGMYNMSLSDLRKKKGVEAKAVLYDFMGSTELAGNYFRVTQTAERIRTKKLRGQSLLEQTAKQIGKQVRATMLENSGTAPESLPISEDVNKVKRRLKSASRKMASLDYASAPYRRGTVPRLKSK